MAESGRGAAQIHGHVEHAARHHAHQLALRANGLIVQAAQHAMLGAGVVFLHESVVADVLAKPVVAEGFHKEAALVAVGFGLDDFHIGQGGVENIHAVRV